MAKLTKTKTKAKVYVLINESLWPTAVVGVFSTRGLALAASKKERAKYPRRLYRLSHHMVRGNVTNPLI